MMPIDRVGKTGGVKRDHHDAESVWVKDCGISIDRDHDHGGSSRSYVGRTLATGIYREAGRSSGLSVRYRAQPDTLKRTISRPSG